MRLNIHQRRSIAWHAAGDSQICRLVDKTVLAWRVLCEYWLMPANASEMLGERWSVLWVASMCVDWLSSVVQRPLVRPFRFMRVKQDCAKLSLLCYFFGPGYWCPDAEAQVLSNCPSGED